MLSTINNGPKFPVVPPWDIHWHPISELQNKYEQNLLLYAPSLVHEDFNRCGTSMGHWQDGPWQDFEDSSIEPSHPDGVWVCASWDNDQECWRVRGVLDVTHYAIVQRPEVT